MTRGIALILAGLVWSVAACTDSREEFPAQLDLEDVLASSSSGFFMEGCTAAEYRLSDRTARAIEAEGFGFFSHVAMAGTGQRAWGNWAETPLASEERYPRAAFGGCDEAPGHTSTDRLEEALRSRGSYYALTANREGMLVIVPRLKLAAFFYGG